MKNALLSIRKTYIISFCISIFLLSSTILNAQETPMKVEIVTKKAEVNGKSEFRLNGLDLLSTATLNVNFERIVSHSEAFGIGMLISLGDGSISEYVFSIDPYYRFYFLNRKDYGASGFFVEAFSSIGLFNDDYISYDNVDSGTTFQTSLGIAVGKKWINESGFTFEVFCGFGRFLISSSNIGTHARVGMSIGKRF